MGTFKFDFTFDKPTVTYIEESAEGADAPSVLSVKAIIYALTLSLPLKILLRI